MEELNKYFGLVVCADCGTAMALHQAHTMSAPYNHFTCRTHKKEGAEVCTAHYIRECILDDVVLEDIRRVTAQAREHTREFAAYISGKQSAEVQRDIRKKTRELDAIFKRLYEDSVLGRITAEQFQTLSDSYTGEMAVLKEKIPEQEAAIRALREQVGSTGHFIALAKRYTDIQELTPELLRRFIRKIVVHEKDVKWSKHARQTVEIHYNDIGWVPSRQGTKQIRICIDKPPADPAEANKGKRDPAPIGAGSQRCWKTLNIPSFCQPQVAVTLGFLHLLARRAISRTVMTRPTMSVIVSGMNINSPATMK